MRNHSVLLSLLFVLFSCSKSTEVKPEIKEEEGSSNIPPKIEEPVEPQTEIYFSANIISYNTSESDNWIMIHDNDGKLLDYKPYEDGDKVVFEALDTELESVQNLTITNFIWNQANGLDLYNLTTSTQVEKGSSWDFEIKTEIKIPKPPMDNGKSYDIIVNNSTELNTFNIQSSRYGKILENQNSDNLDLIEIQGVFLQEEHTFLVSATGMDGIPKYIFIESPKNGNEINLDYDDFIDFEYILTTDLPQHTGIYAQSAGYPTTGTYDFGYNFKTLRESNGGLQLQLPYINDLKEYSTTFQLQMGNIKYGYYLRSSDRPEIINIIDQPSFVLEDSRVMNFLFSTNVNFIRQKSFWSYPRSIVSDDKINMIWTLFGQNEDLKMDVIPEEILMTYSNMDFEQLEHRYTQIFTISDSQSEFLNGLDNVENGLNELEWVIFENP